MIKLPVDLSHYMPIDREKAAEIATLACRFECTLTLEHNNIVLNLKSMIGLLSQSIPKDGRMTLIADGCDEKNAVEELGKKIGIALPF